MLQRIKDWWFGLWNKAELEYLNLMAEVNDRVEQTERLLSILSRSWSSRIADLEAKIRELEERLK